MNAYCCNLKTVPGWPPGSDSRVLQVQDIVFNTRIEILTLTKLYLDLHEWILCVTSKSVPDWPPGSAAGGLQEPPGKSKGPLVCLNMGNYYYLCFLPTKNIIWKQTKPFLVFLPEILKLDMFFQILVIYIVSDNLTNFY